MGVKIGNLVVSDIFVGNSVVAKVFVGNNLVYEKQAPGSPIILSVARFTSDNYIGSTLYTDDSFIYLNIGVKANSSVTVNYDDIDTVLTNSTDADAIQTIRFGKWAGEDDNTAVSGILTITGDYCGLGISSFNKANKTTEYCSCITDIISFGNLYANQLYTSAFRNCTALTSVTLPSQQIGSTLNNYLFSGCTGLLTADISSISTIPSYCFSGCTSLNFSSLPNSIINIGSHAFESCTSLSITSLPNSVTGIEASAFEGCTSLVGTITLSTSLQSIGSGVFALCNNITALLIPSDVLNDINGGLFSRAFNIASVTLSSSNPYYTAVNNQIIYKLTNGVPTELTCFVQNLPSNTELNIPNTVTSYHSNCIWQTINTIQKVTLSSGTTDYPMSLGSISGGLKTLELIIPDNVIIPQSVSNGFQPFRNIQNCIKLTTPFYKYLFADDSSLLTSLEELYISSLQSRDSNPITDSDMHGELKNLIYLQKLSIPTSYASITSSVSSSGGLEYLFYGIDQTKTVDPNEERGYFPATLTEIHVLSPETTFVRQGKVVFTFNTASVANNITTLYLPISLTLLTKYSFTGGSSAVNIYYEGTIANWNLITKETDYTTISRIIHCSDGDITI